MNKNKGFTLIELLIVIAIIGILSAVVLAALNTARAKSNDAAIKQDLTVLRTQAELYADSNSYNYGAIATTTVSTSGVCGGGTGMWSDPSIRAALASAMSVTGNTSRAWCISTSGYWSVAVPFKTDPAQSWCISSSGKAVTITTASLSTTYPGCN